MTSTTFHLQPIIYFQILFFSISGHNLSRLPSIQSTTMRPSTSSAIASNNTNYNFDNNGTAFKSTSNNVNNNGIGDISGSLSALRHDHNPMFSTTNTSVDNINSRQQLTSATSTSTTTPFTPETSYLIHPFSPESEWDRKTGEVVTTKSATLPFENTSNYYDGDMYNVPAEVITGDCDEGLLSKGYCGNDLDDDWFMNPDYPEDVIMLDDPYIGYFNVQGSIGRPTKQTKTKDDGPTLAQLNLLSDMDVDELMTPPQQQCFRKFEKTSRLPDSRKVLEQLRQGHQQPSIQQQMTPQPGSLDGHYAPCTTSSSAVSGSRSGVEISQNQQHQRHLKQQAQTQTRVNVKRERDVTSRFDNYDTACPSTLPSSAISNATSSSSAACSSLSTTVGRTHIKIEPHDDDDDYKDGKKKLPPISTVKSSCQLGTTKSVSFNIKEEGNENENNINKRSERLSSPSATLQLPNPQVMRVRNSSEGSVSSHDEGFASQPEEDSDDDDDSSDDESFYGDYEAKDLLGASTSDDKNNKWALNMGRARKNGQARYFWQYNVQAKGPKGIKIAAVADTAADPHVLHEASDPVFSPECHVEGVKHAGKARRGDGNDLTPNPRKLLMIGLELKKLSKIINDLTPVSDVPVNARNKTRKEKNKLASRACRLKKKAQHEANKIKLFGLQQEHKKTMAIISDIKRLVKETAMTRASPPSSPTEASFMTCVEIGQSAHQPISPVAGRTADFVNSVSISK